MSRMEAVRCVDAAIAAAEGSRFVLSVMERPSCMAVGDGFFGALLRNRRFVENFRDNPPLPSVVGALESSGVGRGCDRSFAAFTKGSISSRSFLFSSDIRMRSSFSIRSSASRSLIM